ncbi:MAG TPA: hypothetical protein VEI01_25625 [Terriglobales bacterium]|nr:hypothetical protein [Terriglobales bacterium]
MQRIFPFVAFEGDLIGTDDAGNFLFYTAATVMGLIASPGKS